MTTKKIDLYRLESIMLREENNNNQYSTTWFKAYEKYQELHDHKYYAYTASGEKYCTKCGKTIND